MPNDRDGQHAGGSIVDTPRANMSPEQIQRDNEARQREQEADQHKEEDQ
ncbi:hypothetical protein ACIA5C_20440 [Actinoplanes sp. NPDC051343]